MQIRLMTIEDYEAVHDLWMTIKGFAIRSVDDSREGVDRFLKRNPTTSVVAEVDGKIAGTAGIDRIGGSEKVKHRASFGISIDKNFWGLGIGRALTKACIECARSAGYEQLELDVVADNKRAIALYESEGFIEYGRNPKGFCSRENGMQELVLMRLELNG